MVPEGLLDPGSVLAIHIHGQVFINSYERVFQDGLYHITTNKIFSYSNSKRYARDIPFVFWATDEYILFQRTDKDYKQI
jgi:hypothetical protein